MCALAEGWCTGALEVLYGVAATQAQAELLLSSDLDVERIAGAMVHLTAVLQDLLNRVAEDEAALPEYRSAARLGLPVARNIWSH